MLALPCPHPVWEESRDQCNKVGTRAEKGGQNDKRRKKQVATNIIFFFRRHANVYCVFSDNT